nr:Hint domain-containing protein [Aquicoccus sp. G2-2]MEA1114010.1 Hint domain-containing protein [Aquicoccus sp. G2-2]
MFGLFGEKSARHAKADRTAEISGAYDGGVTGAKTGIAGGTRVATSMGWRDVAALQEGDMVLTFDGGLQPVSAVIRRRLWDGRGQCPKAFWPLAVPAGALENAKSMMLLPNQGVMLESDVAEDIYGDPFALVPAAALDGLRGIERVLPNDPIDVVCLHFESDQVVFAEHGALLFCPAGGDLVQRALQGSAQLCPYRMLPEPCAIALVQETQPREASDRCLEACRASPEGRGHGQMEAA